MKANILAGCSGFRYLSWRGNFYPPDADSPRMLEVYTNHFNTLEIRETYYGCLVPALLEQWAEAVPEGFCFSLKLARTMVLAKPGSEMMNRWNRFLQSIKPLREKGHPDALLVQVPACLERDPVRLRAWLGTFGEGEWDLVFDFRHPSWYEKSILDLLQKKCADAAAVSRPGGVPFLEVIAKHKYIRLSGESTERNQDYSFKDLSAWWERILAAGAKTEKVYVYFNNPGKGCAPANAKTLLNISYGEKG